MGGKVTAKLKPTHKFEGGVELKRCSRCDLWLTLDRFYPRNRKPGQYLNPCRTCRDRPGLGREVVDSAELARLIVVRWEGTWEELANRCGMSSRQLRRILKGQTRFTQLKVADRVLLELGLNLDVDIEVRRVYYHVHSPTE